MNGHDQATANAIERLERQVRNLSEQVQMVNARLHEMDADAIRRKVQAANQAETDKLNNEATP